MVPEEQDVHAGHDGYQRKHVKHDGCLSSHRFVLLGATKRSKNGRLRWCGVRDDDLSTLAKWEMDPGRMATPPSWVAPPSQAAAKERIARWSASENDDLGFAIETLGDPPVLAGNIGLWGAHPQDRCAAPGIALGREHSRYRAQVLVSTRSTSTTPPTASGPRTHCCSQPAFPSWSI